MASCIFTRIELHRRSSPKRIIILTFEIQLFGHSSRFLYSIEALPFVRFDILMYFIYGVALISIMRISIDDMQLFCCNFQFYVSLDLFFLLLVV